jgi:hypothetical protein
VFFFYQDRSELLSRVRVLIKQMQAVGTKQSSTFTNPDNTNHDVTYRGETTENISEELIDATEEPHVPDSVIHNTPSISPNQASTSGTPMPIMSIEQFREANQDITDNDSEFDLDYGEVE